MTDKHKEIVKKNLPTHSRKKKPRKYTTSDQRPFLVAQAKVLKDTDMSITKIAEFLNINVQTVKRYLAVADTEDIDKMKAIAKTKYLEMDWNLTNTAYARINEHLNDDTKMSTTKLYELTGLYKSARELQRDDVNINANQTNIYINDSGKGFSISTEKPSEANDL